MCSRSVSKNWGFLVQYAPFALPVVLSACPLHTLTPEINSSSDRAKQKNMAENHFYNYTIVKGFQDLNLPLLFNKMYSIIVQKKMQIDVGECAKRRQAVTCPSMAWNCPLLLLLEWKCQTIIFLAPFRIRPKFCLCFLSMY